MPWLCCDNSRSTESANFEAIKEDVEKHSAKAKIRSELHEDVRPMFDRIVDMKKHEIETLQNNSELGEILRAIGKYVNAPENEGSTESGDFCKFLQGDIKHTLLPKKFLDENKHLNFNAISRDETRILQKVINYSAPSLWSGGSINHEKNINKLCYLPQIMSKEIASLAISQLPQFTQNEVDKWLFNGEISNTFPPSRLGERDAERYSPKLEASAVASVGNGKLTSRVSIYAGGITDLKSNDGAMVICTSNNGDLLTGCGYAVAKAVVNAAGAGLQTDLYNKYGVPRVMRVPVYGVENYAATEGRGYAITCNPHDMKKTHGVQSIEMLTVPMHNEEGVKNMYREDFLHSAKSKFIVVPMAGATHPVLQGKPELSATIAIEAFDEFLKNNADSKLNVIFALPEKNVQEAYKKVALSKDS